MNCRIIFFIFIFVLSAKARAREFISNQEPEAEKIAKLSAYFTPPPGTMVFAGADDPTNLHLIRNPEKITGSIVVTPPAGVCFTILQTRESEDKSVCQKTTLFFRAVDIDRSGNINWTIYLNEKDVGTKLTWPTPHRVAYVTKPSKKDETMAPRTILVKSCEPIKTALDEKNIAQRKIYLHLFDGKTWVVKFPQKDVLLPQPPPQSNLNLLAVRRGLESLRGSGPVPANGPEKKEEEGKKEKKSFEEEIARMREERRLKLMETTWTVPVRNAYTMNAANFLTSGNTPPNKKTTCRYQFENAPSEPKSGWIECHEVDDFETIIVPLPCLKELL